MRNPRANIRNPTKIMTNSVTELLLEVAFNTKERNARGMEETKMI